ncbi:MAG: peptide chain release factor N(5)-glutamine methyltransferase [Candidatus Amulumruptor caecigallinarius]|nr:peptide chain release factor N(5)-glutamine methyltransferase [Candidatus Amulumruptor caecigallinarius]MCM1397782.1 peptide chain release factor N(5)-glutamine methyltransferase [Candidatus Amulumruptor caecigallinarius]MCM1454821.1 peptide chain release factor N(5)-glutamine methyltransferase [bacterium]
MTLDQYTDTLTKRFVADGYTRAEATWCIRDIFAALKGWTRAQLVTNGDREVTDELSARVEGVMERIDRGTPIQYALGRARFCGMWLTVTPAVLIPRPETEQLVDMIADSAAGRRNLRVLDIGTGSGCIAIALARALDGAEVTATDISAEALAVAEANARTLGAQVTFTREDILSARPRAASADIIVSNPPYITPSEQSQMSPRVLDHEPHSALFVPQDDPALFYKAIASYAATALTESGVLWLEINPLYADVTLDAVKAAGLTDAELIRDERGKNRFIKACRP